MFQTNLFLDFLHVHSFLRALLQFFISRHASTADEDLSIIAASKQQNRMALSGTFFNPAECKEKKYLQSRNTLAVHQKISRRNLALQRAVPAHRLREMPHG